MTDVSRSATTTTTDPAGLATLAHDAAASAIREEQAALDVAWQRRADLLAELAASLADATAGAEDAVERTRRAGLRSRQAELEAADEGLVFGRLDEVSGAVRRLGRVGLPGDGDEPLVLDWRAPAARPFYTATAAEPQGLARRRHIRTRGGTVLGVDDEPLTQGPEDASASELDESDLVGEGALLAALDERRTGRMGTAVATLQREQDAIVRMDADAPLVVQGGPGTGKTVVALHRVAYLLFTHPEIARRGVLVVGPTRRFLDYIAQVLPALGETAVVAATCDTLVPGVRPSRDEGRTVAETKGRDIWQRGLESLVASRVPSATGLTVAFEGEEYQLPAAMLDSAVRAAGSGGRPFLSARAFVVDRVHEMVTDAVAERQAELLSRVEEGFEDVLGRLDAAFARTDDRAALTGATGADVDGVLTEADLDAVRARVAADPRLAATLEGWWPRLDAAQLLRALLHDAGALRRHLPGLTDAEIAAIVAEPDGWSSSDVALLDALADLIGDDAPPAGGEVFLADRAAAQRDWVYGHAVVDEAQELSPMQWRMVVRRCPTRSITAVGDIDQASSPHPHTNWDDAVGPALGSRRRRADLTICYRTPREVIELTGPVLAAAGSPHLPPRAVRSTGIEPRLLDVRADDVARVAETEVARLRERYDGGTVGVVASPRLLAEVRAAVPDDVPVLSPDVAKGLEWDSTLVVDPDGITAQPRGWNALYVALTRCTQELVQLRVVGTPTPGA